MIIEYYFDKHEKIIKKILQSNKYSFFFFN